MSGWTDNYIQVNYNSESINFDPIKIKIIKNNNGKVMGEIIEKL